MPHHSDDARIQLFTPIFIDFLQHKFLGKETAEGFEGKNYDYAELIHDLPLVYKDSELIYWGIDYLKSKGTIQQMPSNNNDLIRWELTERAVRDKLNEKASNDLNRRIDLAIKQRTLDQLEANLEDRPINNKRANIAVIISIVAVLLTIAAMLWKK